MEVGGPAKEEDERRKLKDGSWRSDDGDCLIGAIEANQLGEPFLSYRRVFQQIFSGCSTLIDGVFFFLQYYYYLLLN